MVIIIMMMIVNEAANAVAYKCWKLTQGQCVTWWFKYRRGYCSLQYGDSIFVFWMAICEESSGNGTGCLSQGWTELIDRHWSALNHGCSVMCDASLEEKVAIRCCYADKSCAVFIYWIYWFHRHRCHIFLLVLCLTRQLVFIVTLLSFCSSIFQDLRIS